MVSTALHDFFGGAVVEACYCNCFPILPNRLAYPELIPTAHQESCLYDDFDGLVGRLRRAIVEVAESRSFSLRGEMARFDWRHMAPHYDRLLAQAV